jgi:hypothetical protein
VKNGSEALIRWDARAGEISAFAAFPDSFARPKTAASSLRPIDCGDYLLLFPNWESAILRFDKRCETFSEYREMPVPDEPDHIQFKYGSPKRIGDRVFAFARFNKTVYELDIPSGTVREHRFRLDEESRAAVDALAAYVPEGCAFDDPARFIFGENAFIGGLQGFLSGSLERSEARGKAFRNALAGPAADAGAAIYAAVKALCGETRERNS